MTTSNNILKKIDRSGELPERKYRTYNYGFVFSSDIQKWIRGKSKVINRYDS